MKRRKQKKEQEVLLESTEIDLANKYRPKNLDEIYGNALLKKALKTMVQENAIPHAVMLSGPAGCAKTSLARILARELKCSDFDCKEIDVADFSGIDMIRDLRRKMNTAPMKGPVKVYILDECFAKGTTIKTPEGDKKIETVKINDLVYSIAGLTKVNYVHKNKVSLDRVVKLIFSNNVTLYTTKEHKFLTTKGWERAEDLEVAKHLLFPFLPDRVEENTNLYPVKKEGNNEATKKKMSQLQKRIHTKERKTCVLLTSLCGGKKGVPQLRCVFQRCLLLSKSILLKKLWHFLEPKKQCGVQEDCLLKGNATEKIRDTKNIQVPGTGKIQKAGSSFNTDISEHMPQRKITTKSNADKAGEWDTAQISWGERRKRKADSRPGNTGERPRMEKKKNNKMATGVCDKFGEIAKRISFKLQSRCWESHFKIGNRSRWEGASSEDKYNKRCEKNKKAGITWLESAEIYKRGNNDESFKSIIGDTERDQNFVIFYDLEIENHPSYFANSIPVHNCALLGRGGSSEKNEAQSALLKALEEPPKHVYFFLCTTDPQNVLKTIHSRCVQYQVQTLSEKQIYQLVSDVAQKEGFELPKKVALQIGRDSLGTPRNALKILSKIRYLDEDDMLGAALQEAEKVEQSIALCRAIMNKRSWKEIAEILRSLKDEPESVRRHIRSYFNTILLNGNESAFVVLDVFNTPYFNIDGKVSLTRDCYEAYKEFE